MIEGVDYCYIFPKEDNTTVHVKFLTGNYTGTVFKYGQVKFEEKDNNGYLLFNYDVIECTVGESSKLEQDDDFKNCIGNLLVEIMSANMDQEIIDENGTIDTVESSS